MQLWNPFQPVIILEPGGGEGLPNLMKEEEKDEDEEEKKEDGDVEEEMKGNMRDEEELQDSLVVEKGMIV